MPVLWALHLCNVDGMFMSCVIGAGSRRGPRRTGSQQDDSDYSTGRPSAPATLFDFVTSKMPQSSSLGTLSNYFSLFCQFLSSLVAQCMLFISESFYMVTCMLGGILYLLTSKMILLTELL